MKFLETLYCSGVNPQEEIGIPNHDDYQYAVQKHANAQETFYKTLSEEQKELCYEVLRKFAVKANYEDSHIFAYAFRLGSQFMSEVLKSID